MAKARPTFTKRMRERQKAEKKLRKAERRQTRTNEDGSSKSSLDDMMETYNPMMNPDPDDVPPQV